ncbi:MAG: hypothetical protein AAGA48_02405 [Myxococcota bacterium]
MRVWLFWGLFVACTGDDGSDLTPPIRRGGLAVRVVIAEPPEDPGVDPCAEGNGDDDQDDDDDDDQDSNDDPDGDVAVLPLRSANFTAVDLQLTEFRLTVTGETERTFTVPLDRQLDLVGPATSDDEIVLDLELADYPSSILELVGASVGPEAVFAARATACVATDETSLSRTVEFRVPDALSLVSEPVRLVLGDGPDPRVRLGLRVDQWLDGMMPPASAEVPWIIEPEHPDYDTFLSNLQSAVETEVD